MSNGMDVSENEVHAFIDGALDDDRARIVAARVAADPALADRVANFRADMAMLKQVYGPLSGRPLPREWLTLTQNSRPAAASSWRMAAAIAAVLLAALALAPFAYRALQPSSSGEIVAAALAARQSRAETAMPVTDTGAARYDSMLSAAVSERVKVPDLEKMGYRLTAIQLYPGAPGGSAAELLYRDRANRLFTLYLRRSDGTARFDQFERAGLRVCIWQDDQLGMVMAGNVTTASMQRLASLAYTGLTL
jgi:anti-sigma factor RsiW